MPSFSFTDNPQSLIPDRGPRECTSQFPVKTRPLPRVADDAVAECLDLQQHRVVVAVDQDLLDGKAVARRLALRPQLPARAAEERREPRVARLLQRLVVHEA